MSDDPGLERIKALEARISKAKGDIGPKVSTGAGGAFSQGEVAWRMVIELVSGMLLGLSIGYGLDVWFQTLPVFLVIFALLGFAAGVKTMLGTAREMAAKHNETLKVGTPAVSKGAESGN